MLNVRSILFKFVHDHTGVRLESVVQADPSSLPIPRHSPRYSVTPRFRLHTKVIVCPIIDPPTPGLETLSIAYKFVLLIYLIYKL